MLSLQAGACSAIASGWRLQWRRLAEPFELDHLDLIAVVPGDLVARIDLDVELAELHVQRVERQVAADERLAHAEDDLDGLDRLDGADDAGQRPQHAGLGAARRQLGRGRLGEHVPVGRAVATAAEGNAVGEF